MGKVPQETSRRDSAIASESTHPKRKRRPLSAEHKAKLSRALAIPATDERYKRQCQHCKKEFYLNPRHGVGWSLKTGRGHFCSTPCARAASRGQRRSIATEFKPGDKVNAGRSRSFETRKKLSMALSGVAEDEWEGFASSERTQLMRSKEYIEWRKQVFQRDYFICQSCGRRSGSGLSLFLEAHHIKRIKEYPDLVFNVANGITLCKDCHVETRKARNKVAVIGSEGWVGNSMIDLFKTKLQVIPYDIIGIGTKAEVNKCAAALVCVPTAPLANGRLDTSIVEEVVAWLKVPLIIIRSTLNPGTADYLEQRYGQNISVMPEYLGETAAHPLSDDKAQSFLIIGGQPAVRRKTIELFQNVYNAGVTIRQMTNYEAELVKLGENRAIAWKVMEAHELYEACEAAGIDYYTIREAVYGDDPRFNLWFTFADPDNLGFDSSKCLVKDVPAWVAWAEGVGADASLTRRLVEKSKEYATKR